MNWTRMTRVAACGVLLALSGCGGGNSTKPNPTPTPTPAGPWDFPASSKFAVTLYADSAAFAVGDSFDVKVVAYNVQDVFGAALQINYPHDLLGVGRIVYNPTPFANSSTYFLLPARIEPDSNRVSFGFTFLRGSHRSVSGSAVVMRLRCRANAAGTANLKIDPVNLALQDSTGSSIPNFGGLEVDSLSVTLH